MVWQQLNYWKLIRSLNEDSVIKPGEKVNVTILKPLVEVKAYFESKKRETISFKKVTENDKTLNKGDKKVTQKGSDGEKNSY